MGAPARIFDNVAVSAAQDHVSDIVVADDDVALISFHLLWQGAITGTIVLYQSNLPQPGKSPAGKGWVPVPSAEVDFTGKIPAGATGSSLVNISATSGSKYILVYTHATGAGVLDCYQVSKAAGAVGATGPQGPTGPTGPSGNTEATVPLVGVAGLYQKDLNQFYDGAIMETTAVVVSSDGAVITLSAQKVGGGNLFVRIHREAHLWVTTPAATVSLVAGTDTVPTENFVYLTESGGVLTLVASAVGWPSGEYAAIATVVCQSAASLQTDGAYKIHAYTDNVHEIGQRGHLVEINKWIRRQQATWQSGLAALNMTVVSPDAYFATEVGVAFQLHGHSFPARDMALGDPAWLVNDPTTPFKRITTLDDVTQLADASAINNRWFSLVLWGSVNEEDADCKLFINLPTGSYSNQSRAEADTSDYAVFSIPSQFKGTGILLAEYIVQGKTSGAWVQGSKVDMRGLVPSSSPGAGTHDHSELYLADGTRPMTGDLNHDGTLVGLYGATPVAQAAAYTPTNVTPTRAFNADATTLDELADIVGTLIADLKALGPIG